MDDREATTEREEGAMHGDEAKVRRALTGAGPRTPLRQRDLDAIETAARAAWRAKVAEVVAEREAAPAAVRPAARWGRSPWLAAVAACAVAAAGLGVWWTARDAAPAVVAKVEAVDGAVRLAARESGEDGGVRPLAAADELAAGAALDSRGDGVATAGRAALRIAGGTELRLDAGTRLRLLSASRVELAAGAVYVDTGGGSGGPLAVVTPLGTVRDVGTRFVVRLAGRGEGASVEVAVREGEVAVEVAVEAAAQGSAGGGAPALRLAAGEGATVAADGAVTRGPVAPHGAAWEWVLAAAPPYAVDGRSLEEFLAWVEAETGWRVVYADPALAARAPGIVLYGDVGGLRPDEAPFAVLPGADLRAELNDGVLVIGQR